MKKILFLSFLIAIVSTESYSAPVNNTENNFNWYVTGRAELSLMNWTNKYSSDFPGADQGFNEDKYSFEPLFGANLAVGARFYDVWRTDLEIGYLGKYEDKDNSTEFSFAVPYILVNGYYDFYQGFYAGLGVGTAITIKTMDYEDFISGGRTKTSVYPMGAFMLGYSKNMGDNLFLDLRYRLSGFYAGSQTRYIQYINESEPNVVRDAFVENKIGFVLDNSFSIGLRYEF